MNNPKIMLASTYEAGFQPISVGTAAAHLLKHGFNPICLDTFVDYPEESAFADVDLLAISLQLFQSVEASVELAKMARRANPTMIIAMFGQHANIHAERLVGKYCDYVIRGDWEPAIVGLARKVRGEEVELELPGLCQPGHISAPYIHRDDYLPPARHLLPELLKYNYQEFEKFQNDPSKRKVVANVETARGCHHACTYCSVFAATGRKVNIIPQDVVMADIRQVVEMGASHICFVDADFINSKVHGLNVVRQMHKEFPHLSFDITTRADHILDNKETLLELRDLGLEFVTSALEFPTQRVLDAVDKELTMEQVDQAIAYCHEIGVKMNPTFIMFNPWVNLEDLMYFREWIERVGLAQTVDPVQFETRLYLYKGSPLLNNEDIKKLELTEEGEFKVEWKHSDPRVDQLFRETVKPPEPGVFKRCCIKC